MTKQLNSSKRLVLSAFGIHMGGGYVLLKELISNSGNVLRAAALDERLAADEVVPSDIPDVHFVKRSFVSRVLSSVRLASMTTPGDVLLCFNSLPPLRRANGHVVLYVHSAHFVGAHKGMPYALITRIRLAIERLWFKAYIGNANEIWVQTGTVAELLRASYPCASIKVVPLIDEQLYARLVLGEREVSPDMASHSDITFFYPADAVGHKNHLNLIRAWVLLEKLGKRPRLVLTLRDSEWESITAQLGEFHSNALLIDNLGRLSRERVLEQFRASSALIFPSMAETFGLPLLEARALDVPIIASERDFVRDVCVPAQTFDPASPRSIAMAVTRFIERRAAIECEFFNARQFLGRLLA